MSAARIARLRGPRTIGVLPIIKFVSGVFLIFAFDGIAFMLRPANLQYAKPLASRTAD